MSMQFWDNPTVDGFHSLLMTPKPMIRTSDHLFQYGSDFLIFFVKFSLPCASLQNTSFPSFHAIYFPFTYSICRQFNGLMFVGITKDGFYF